MDHDPLPSAGHAEGRVAAATPDVARRVAEVLRRRSASAGQRGHPAGRGGAARLHLTIDTLHTAEPARSWPAAGESTRQDRAHPDEV